MGYSTKVFVYYCSNMLNMKRLFLCCVVLAFISETIAQQPNAALDRFLERKIDSLKITGIAVSVVREGKVVYRKLHGTASIEWQQPVGPHTLFQIASVSKLLASTVVLRAMHKGLLRLDDPVSKFIDSVPGSWSGLQVRHLLSHSSGLPAISGNPDLPAATIVRMLRDSALQYPIGTEQRYLSSDYTVLRYLLERACGQSYEDLVRAFIAAPAGMRDGGFDGERRNGTWIESIPLRRKSSTYYGAEGAKRAYKFSYPAATYAAGGYFASITDMEAWAIALDHGTLFPERWARSQQWRADSIGKNGSFSDAGWGLEKEDGIIFGGHSGGPGLADILRFPEQGYTIIVLSNDGELLPGTARAIAPFFVKSLKPADGFAKFKRQ